MYCIIMAGGSGKRFWPLSRKDYPKQLLKIVGNKSMLQMTVDRLRKIRMVEDIFIVTRSDLAEKIGNSIEGISKKNIIVEPSGKNTAPCIGLSALHLEKFKKDAVMGVFPADHIIVGHRKFVKALKNSSKIALQKHSIVTVGIKPTFPSTAYGYIQHTQEEDSAYPNAFHLKTFAEKPHLSVAKRFLKSGDFLWNSGIFVWRVDVLLNLMKKHTSDLYSHLMEMKPLIKKNKNIVDVWEKIEPESIDYGLMEKIVSDAYVVKADFEWNDLGSWNAISKLLPKTQGKNVIRGDGIVVNGKGNFIHSDNHFTSVVGLEDVVVVHTKEATLVVHKDSVEDVKLLTDKISKSNREELL